jgi:hypothetical protein
MLIVDKDWKGYIPLCNETDQKAFQLFGNLP